MKTQTLVNAAVDQLLKHGWRGISFKPTVDCWGKPQIEFWTCYNVHQINYYLDRYGDLRAIPSRLQGIIVEGYGWNDVLCWDIPF